MNTPRRSANLLPALGLSLGLLLSAPLATAQTVQPEGSEIRFVTRQMGVPVEGRFTRWQADLRFDPRQPQAGQIAFRIDTRSIAFGAPDTEAEAAKAEWFDSARFAQADFRSRAIKALGGGRFEVAGSLTIKGRTQDVVVPVVLAPAAGGGGQGTASGSFTLKRMDFKLGEGEWADLSVVANEVQVRFKLQVAGLAPP